MSYIHIFMYIITFFWSQPGPYLKWEYFTPNRPKYNFQLFYSHNLSLFLVLELWKASHLQTEIKSQQSQPATTKDAQSQLPSPLGPLFFRLLRRLRSLHFSSSANSFPLQPVTLFSPSCSSFLLQFLREKKPSIGDSGSLCGNGRSHWRLSRQGLKDRLEELKVETGYYKTKTLIEKYDETEKQNVKQSEIRKRPEQGLKLVKQVLLLALEVTLLVIL